MAFTNSRISALVASAAALSLVASPAAAVDLPRSTSAKVSEYVPSASEDISEHRRYRRHRHRGGVSAGDVLTGILILGGIAVIANSAKGERHRDDDRRYDDRRYDPRYEPRDYDDRRDYDRRGNLDGLERAANMCADAAENRGLRVDTVDEASRGAAGWSIAGDLRGGGRWTCRIDNSGRVTDVGAGGDVSYEPQEDRQDDWGGQGDNYVRAAPARAPGSAPRQDDRQYGDDVYASARANRSAGGYMPQPQGQPGYAPRSEPAQAPAPAPSTRDGNDGRYQTGSVGDFEQDGY
ncbi:hypothetical protein [Paraurantiacibacter namhicola]|uniref:17 kDa surface antigen n=1 Tax=Paraurantiacibacter namhicola TaxID=645517 RepID=A0A1C7D876_9SPHN|nr:hypothetical protein [Paraurantiacibacter namhicola]ANU07645.1 hypothetical protein A6F65_01339 [Paraurantiacibacter namhicola]